MYRASPSNARHQRVFAELDRRRLLVPPRLDFDIDVNQRNGRRRDTGNARSLRQGARADTLQFFVHLTGEAADRLVIEPFRNGALLGFLQALDGALLLLQIAGIFDGGLHRLEFVTHRRRQSPLAADISGGAGINLRDGLGNQLAQNRRELFDGDLWTLENLSESAADSARQVLGSQFSVLRRVSSFKFRVSSNSFFISLVAWMIRTGQMPSAKC